MSVASEDIVKAINFCRVFTELGESLLFRIVHNSAPQTPYFATSVFESILTWNVVQCCHEISLRAFLGMLKHRKGGPAVVQYWLSTPSSEI